LKLLLHEDVPLYWDAWDVEMFHKGLTIAVGFGQVELVERGPLRAMPRVRFIKLPLVLSIWAILCLIWAATKT
jgi:alpha-mannosidase